jgi:hypothetical protein
VLLPQRFSYALVRQQYVLQPALQPVPHVPMPFAQGLLQARDDAGQFGLVREAGMCLSSKVSSGHLEPHGEKPPQVAIAVCCVDAP